MKKIQFILLLILLLSGCGAFKSKVSSYPEGILFPIEMDGEVLYDGEIIERIQKNENRLYFSTRKGFIYGLNATDYNIEWRLRMVERLAAHLDPERFGLKGLWVFGSTKNATAGPGSDIDILIHFVGSDQQRQDLLLWVEGWSLALSEINYVRTGYRTDGLLDVRLISEKDIESRTSYAVKIGAVTDPARALPLGAALKD